MWYEVSLIVKEGKGEDYHLRIPAVVCEKLETD